MTIRAMVLEGAVSEGGDTGHNTSMSFAVESPLVLTFGWPPIKPSGVK